MSEINTADIQVQCKKIIKTEVSMYKFLVHAVSYNAHRQKVRHENKKDLAEILTLRQLKFYISAWLL